MDAPIIIGETAGMGRDRGSKVYGDEYAIKCVSKANLDERVPSALISGVRSSKSVTPSDSLMLLILEYVPGENLSSFLEHAVIMTEATSLPLLSYTCASYLPCSPRCVRQSHSVMTSRSSIAISSQGASLSATLGRPWLMGARSVTSSSS
ncbi:hypothetical protein CPB85DRAFT_192268 [Mucidula mucida]|nr:hypothetical protein CPB85DRAFT_192268 [Mucidula mucida]